MLSRGTKQQRVKAVLLKQLRDNRSAQVDTFILGQEHELVAMLVRDWLCAPGRIASGNDRNTADEVGWKVSNQVLGPVFVLQLASEAFVAKGVVGKLPNSRKERRANLLKEEGRQAVVVIWTFHAPWMSLALGACHSGLDFFHCFELQPLGLIALDVVERPRDEAPRARQNGVLLVLGGGGFISLMENTAQVRESDGVGLSKFGAELPQAEIAPVNVRRHFDAFRRHIGLDERTPSPRSGLWVDRGWPRRRHGSSCCNETGRN